MTDEQKRLHLLRLQCDLTHRALPAGSLHSYWDAILDIDAFLKDKPTILNKNVDEWINYAESLLKEP